MRKGILRLRVLYVENRDRMGMSIRAAAGKLTIRSCTPTLGDWQRLESENDINGVLKGAVSIRSRA
jgi:hypothetical protein